MGNIKKPAAVLFSGGKDSCLALHLAKLKGYNLSYLLSILPEEDAFLFHNPNVNLLKKQAEMLGIDLIVETAKFGEKREMESLRRLLKKISGKVDFIVVGGIASNYQGGKFEKVCREFGLKMVAPIWNFSGEKIWGRILDKNFKVILTKISCEGLDKNLLGKIIDKENLEKLKELSEKYNFRIDFEGGEAESAVLNMPDFKKEIKLEFEIKSEGKYRHFIDIKKVI